MNLKEYNTPMRKTIGKFILVSAISVTMLLGGCASPYSATSYSSSQTRKAQTVELGTVMSVQNVKVEGKQNEFITIGGAVLGGLAGSKIGQGKGAIAGAVVGALAGGAGAEAAQRSLGGKPMIEVTVKLDGGSILSIVQSADVPLSSGQRVRVMRGGGTDRVVPY